MVETQHIGSYEVREEIGRGGYAVVYRAFQPTIEREVAIKVILPEHVSQPDFKRRFEMEAQLVAQLEHPYIIPLYDFWTSEDGAFLVMRWLRGALRGLADQQGKLTLKQTMRFYDQLAEALQVAHDARIIHRDIKPDNILIDQYGNAYLSDFGIAKNLAIDATVTSDEDFVGTPAYLSPEQIKGDQVSPQTDIYALGIMLYELLTGQPPFPRSMQIFYNHLEVPVPPTRVIDPELPEAIDVVIAQATAKDPERRFSTVTAMAEALREAIIPQAQSILPVQEQPKTVAPARHVFISYAREDSAFVYRLSYDLQAEGVPVWIDKQGLKPGTRNWEDALRDAIQTAYAVVVVASPESRRSNYVQDELAIAQMYNCPVYAVWAAGDDWIDSIALGWGGLQYLDARSTHYERVLPELVIALGGRARGQDDATDPSITELPENFAPRNPYKGLRAFQQSDEGDFFGRSSLIAELLGLVAANMQGKAGAKRFLAVIGASGSGKSSVVMAGLLPALRAGSLPGSDKWIYLPPIVPGVDPIESLTIALAGQLPGQSHANIREDLYSTRGLHMLARQIAVQHERGGQGQTPVVLYVDQFEELFTQTANEDLRQHFIDLLLTAVEEPGGSVLVIITLRADFYDRPMNYPELGKLVEVNSKAVLPMSLADLYDVVQKPSRLPDVMLLYDPGLVAELVFEVRDQVGGLPLLQFTLDQLFERRDGRRLTYDAYQQIGGLRGALAKHAEETFNALPGDNHRTMARALFLRLIEPGSTEQDTTRRRAPLQELVLADVGQTRIMRAAADAFVNARLLFTEQNTIEVSHEALIREWPRLRTWLDEARVDIDLQQTLSADTENWVARGRRPDDDGLYRGTLLENAQAWAARNVPNADEVAFLTASAARQATERAREEAIARRVQNFGRAAAVLGLVGVIAVIATVLAFLQASAATTAQRSAEDQQQTSVAREGDANTQVAQAGETLTPIPLTLTPVAATLIAGEQQLATAQIAIIDANQLADGAQTQVSESNQMAAGAQTQVFDSNLLAQRAQTQVAQAGETLTPIPLTLTPVSLTLAAGEVRLSTAQFEVTEANNLALEAETQVAESNLLADGAQTQVFASNLLAQGAQTQVAQAGETLTPIPLTLTPVALTLVAGDQQVAQAQAELALAVTVVEGAQTQAAQSNVQAAAAETQVALAATAQNEARAEAFFAQTQAAIAGLTLTPVPLTLTPAAEALIEAGEQARLAATQVADANVQVNRAGTQIAAADQQVLESRLTLTPIAATLAAGDLQLTAAQGQIVEANALADGAQTQVADANVQVNRADQQVLESRLTLTPIAATLAAGDLQLTAAQGQIVEANALADGAQTQVADSNAQANIAGTRVASAEQQVIDAGLTLTPVPLTLTPVALTLEAGNAQVATAQSEVLVVQQQVTLVGLTLTPVQATLIAAEAAAAFNQSQAASQSLAVNAEQAITNDNYDLALTLALEALRIKPDLTQAQRLVNQLAYSGARFSFDTPIAALHPQSRVVAHVFGNTTVVSNLADRAEIFRLDGHTASITDLAFSPDGSLLASASEDSTIILWDIMTGSIRYQLTGHSGKVNAVDFNSDGTTLVSGGDDNQNILWNPAAGAEIARRSFNNAGRPIFRVQFDQANAFRFYSWEQVGDSVTMMLWDTRNNAAVWTSIEALYDYNQPIGRYVLNTQELASQLSAWDGGNLIQARNFTNILQAGESVTARAISGNQMLAGLANANAGSVNRLVLLDIGTGAVIRQFDGEGAQRVNALGFSPDGRLAASGYGQFLIVWDIESGREVFRLAAHNDNIASIRFSADGRFALTRSRDGNARVWDMTGGDPAQINTVIAETQNNRVSFPGFSPDGAQVYGSLEVDVFAWGALDSQQINRIFMGDNLLSAGYSPTQPYVLTIFPNGARLWDMSRPATEAQVRPMGAANEQYEEGAAPPAFSPDGQYVVLYGSEFAVWEVATNSRVSTLDQSAIKAGDEVLSLAMTPDNRFVLGATGDVATAAEAFASDIIVWNAASGAVMGRFGADFHNRTIYDVAVAPDGATALSASGDGTLILWDIGTGRLLRRLAGHRGAVRHVVFTPDGTRALSASDDATIILWDLTSGQPIRRYTGHTTPINGLALSNDGRTFITTTGAEAVYVWRLETIEEVLDWTYLNRYIEQLSCDEGRQFGVTLGCS